MAENITSYNDLYEMQTAEHPDWKPSRNDLAYVSHGTGSDRDRIFKLSDIANETDNVVLVQKGDANYSVLKTLVFEEGRVPVIVDASSTAKTFYIPSGGLDTSGTSDEFVFYAFVRSYTQGAVEKKIKVLRFAENSDTPVEDAYDIDFSDKLITQRVAASANSPSLNGFELKKTLLLLSNLKSGGGGQYSNFNVEYDSTNEDYDASFDGTMDIGTGNYKILVNKKLVIENNSPVITDAKGSLSVLFKSNDGTIIKQAVIGNDGIEFYAMDNGTFKKVLGFDNQMYNDLRISGQNNLTDGNDSSINAAKVLNSSVIYTDGSNDDWQADTVWSYAGQRRMIFNNSATDITVKYAQAKIVNGAWASKVNSATTSDLGTVTIPAYSGRYAVYTGAKTTVGGVDFAAFVFE